VDSSNKEVDRQYGVTRFPGHCLREEEYLQQEGKEVLIKATPKTGRKHIYEKTSPYGYQYGYNKELFPNLRLLAMSAPW